VAVNDIHDIGAPGNQKGSDLITSARFGGGYTFKHSLNDDGMRQTDVLLGFSYWFSKKKHAFSLRRDTEGDVELKKVHPKT